MPHAEIGDQRLYYEDTGGDGSVVVFSHGLYMDSRMFDAQVEQLRDRYRVITWDERGHGRSEGPPLPFTYWDSARDLLGLLDQLEVERAVLAGMSQGGYLSLRAALLAPERVSALVLLDTQVGPEDPAKRADYDELLATWERDGLNEPLASIVAQIIIGSDFPGTETWKQRWREMDFAWVSRGYRTLVEREDDVRPRLAELEMPALVVHGEADAAIELAVARELSDALADGELVVVAGAGHAANLTHPEAVNPHIERFLSSVVAAGV